MYDHDFIFKTVYDLNSEEIKFNKWTFSKNRKNSCAYSGVSSKIMLGEMMDIHHLG